MHGCRGLVTYFSILELRGKEKMSEPPFRLSVNRIIYLNFLWLFGLLHFITCLGDTPTRELPVSEGIYTSSTSLCT